MQRSQVAELTEFLLSIAVFFSYHFWLFYVRPRVHWHRKNTFDVWSTNRNARGAWAVEISRSTADALQTYAVQTLRNSITASSFLATACSLIAVTGIGGALLDVNKVNRLEAIARSDPALKGGPSIFSATTKLALAEATILFSFLCLMQSIRLQVHMVRFDTSKAFYARNIASERNEEHIYEEEVLVAMSNRASTLFTLGVRAFYAFIPLLMWNAGPTWMLVITVLEVASLVFTDSIPRPRHMPYEELSPDPPRRDVEMALPQSSPQPSVAPTVDATAPSTAVKQHSSGLPKQDSEKRLNSKARGSKAH